MQKQYLILFSLLLLTKRIYTLTASECEIETAPQEICAYDRTFSHKQVVNCLLENLTIKSKLFCEIDTSFESHKTCGNNGCIVAKLDLSPYNGRYSYLRYFDVIDYATFRWRIVKENSTEKESHRKVVKNSLEYDKFYYKNVTLNETEDGLSKTGSLVITNPSMETKYDVCVAMLISSDTANPIEFSSEKICCHIIIEQEEEEVISFNMELIMIGFLILFYVLIAIMAWKCPHKPNIDEILKTLTPERAEALQQLSERRPEELRRRTMRRRGISAVESTTSVSEAASNFEDEQNIEEPRVTYTSARNDNHEIRITVEEPQATTTVSADNLAYSDDHIEIVPAHENNKGTIVSALDVNTASPLDTKRKYQRRHTAFAFDDDIKPIKNKKELRRKSVQFFTEVLESKSDDLDSDNRDRDLLDNNDLTKKEKFLKQKELNRRRQSMLIGPEFFLNAQKKKNKDKSVKFGGSDEIKVEKKEDDDDEDNTLQNAYEEAAAKVHAQKTRRASVYPFQKAFALDISDSD